MTPALVTSLRAQMAALVRSLDDGKVSAIDFDVQHRKLSDLLRAAEGRHRGKPGDQP